MIGQSIKVFLSNGMQAEGIVDNWDERFLILSNNQNPDKLVINNPDRNLIMFKIVGQREQRPIQPFSLPKEPEVDLSSLPVSEFKDLKSSSIPQLREMQRKQYLNKLSKEMKKFNIQTENRQQYGFPPSFYTQNGSTKKIK